MSLIMMSSSNTTADDVEDGSSIDDYDTSTTSFSVLFIVTAALGIAWLFVIPVVIFVWHRYHDQDDDEEDEANALDPPAVLSKTKRILYTGSFLSTILLLVGLSLLAVYASKSMSSSISSDHYDDDDDDYYYDHHGPMNVRFYDIRPPREFWQSSGLTRHRVVELTVRVELEWERSSSSSSSSQPITSTNNNDTTTTTSNTQQQQEQEWCSSKATYDPCTFVTLCDDSKECSDQEIQTTTAQVRHCIQEALLQKSSTSTTNNQQRPPIQFSMDDDELLYHPFDTTTATSDGKEQFLPTLSWFHGDSETCQVQNPFSTARTTRTETMAYLGGFFIGVGILLHVACIVRISEGRNTYEDGDTECSSVATIEDVMGKEEEEHEDTDGSSVASIEEVEVKEHV
jgi:hypothetical protein